MGLFLSRLIKTFSDLTMGGCEARILMVGLDAAGKTTILYKFKLNETVTTIPTIGFNVETVTPTKGLNFTVWDIGGQNKIRPLWKHYFHNTDGIIYVVDSSDVARVAESSEELWGLMEDDALRGVPVQIIANKQDLPNAMSAAKIIDQLHLRKLGNASRRWHVQGACATNGEGLYEAMDSLCHMIKTQRKGNGQ